MKKLLLFFVLVVLLPIVAAQAAVEPKLVGSSVASLQLNWDIDLGGQSPSSASFTSFSFLNTSTQSVSFSTSIPFTTSTDEFGNALITFNINPTQQRQRILMTSLIKADSENGLEPVQGDLANFLQPSQYVVITEQIAAKAREVVRSESNPLKKAALLTSWVHNNVVYDLAYQDVVLNSQEVFEIRRGVCNEYSHLLLAMLRSVGLPSRFAAGFVYSGEIWAAHAWVEVAINGKWYPFDPTYNEGILVDATHLKFANGIDQANVTEQFSARGAIDLSSVSLLRSHDVSLISYQPFSQAPRMELFLLNQTVQANSLQNVTVSIQSTYPEVVTYPISVDVPPEVKVVSDRTMLLMLFPGEKRFVTWNVLLPANLQEGFIYTFPVIVRSLGAKAQGAIQAQRGESQTFALLQVKDVRLQGRNLIFSIRNVGNAAFSNATAQVYVPPILLQRQFSLQQGSETNLEFTFNNINLSQGLEGNITLTAGNYSTSQPFRVEPPKQREPARPAFNIQAAKVIIEEEKPFYEEFLVYGAAIVLILFIAIIIKLRMG